MSLIETDIGRLQTQNTNREMDLNNGSEITIVACEKSPAGDKRIMRTRKGTIFSSYPLSSQKFEMADFIQNIGRKRFKTPLFHTEEYVQLYPGYSISRTLQNVLLKTDSAFFMHD